jgi:hypothetical protein
VNRVLYPERRIRGRQQARGSDEDVETASERHPRRGREGPRRRLKAPERGTERRPEGGAGPVEAAAEPAAAQGPVLSVFFTSFIIQ